MIRHEPLARMLGFFFLITAAGLLLRPLLPIDETRYLAVAWEMHQSGNWFVPTKNFAPYSDKPPLLFWAINVMWLITGVSEIAGRLVTPLFTCLAIWLTSILARKLWPDDPEIGNRAAVASTGLSIFVLWGGLTMFDVPLAVAVLLGLLALTRAGSPSGNFRHWTEFGAAVALGVLTKGPVILFHLFPAALTLPLWARVGMPWRAIPARLGAGLLVAFALVCLWLVPAALTGGADYRDAILWHQSAGRLAESFAHARPWWFYLALLPVLGFPLAWSPALWRSGGTAQWRTDRGLRLCLIWFASAVFLFSLTSGKQIHYLVPELPALALIAARLTRSGERMTHLPAVAAIGLLSGVAVLAAAGLLPLGAMRYLLVPRTMFVACALLLVALCWLALQRGGLSGAAILSLGSLLVVNLLIGMTKIGAVYSAHPIAELIAPAQAGGIAITGQAYNAEFNFAARLTQPVATPATPKELEDWIDSHPQGLIVGEVDRPGPAWPPRETIAFQGRDYGLWRVADAPHPSREDM